MCKSIFEMEIYVINYNVRNLLNNILYTIDKLYNYV